jgi:superfamily II DNA or RNA helicase
MSPKFKIGDEVQSVSDPNRIGTVVEICELHNDIQYYRVNFGPLGRPKKPEIDLRPYIPANDPCTNLINGNIDGYKEFQRLITYQRLLRDYPLRNNIYAFNASRTRFYPYQFKPLIKFLDSPKHRLLIADEVGLGKTIEAGLILTEVRARQTVQRVLVVCPANLTDKWRMELRRRFGEDFQILNTHKFNDFLKEYEESPQDINLNGIISLESIRKQQMLEQIEALAPNFNLVIVDEAHHMRNFGRKQRRAGVLLNRCADAMLFLTATPIHLGNEDLFSLLNILDDEEFPDLYTVDLRFRANEPIVKAQICMGQIPSNSEKAIELLNPISESPWIKKNPLYSEIMERLGAINSGDYERGEGRRLILQTQRGLAELNLLGHIFTRTKKREVQTKMPLRRAFPLRLRLTDMERQFYDVVTAYVRSQIEFCSNCPIIQSWMLIMPQRRMASSIPAMVNYYKEHFGFDENSLSEDYTPPEEISDENELGNLDFAKAEQLLKSIVGKWPKNGPDSKYDAFIDILRKLRREEGHLKVMVFAFFKDTLRYLQRRLNEDGFRSEIISGDVDPEDRVSIVENFKEEASVEILLSSRVGSEGLDFQFCNILFNYDLPWNPMEVEQRIGRLDRIGQESPVIRIYNFWIEKTVEQRILEKLYMRIGVFERSIGELEMILGKELSNIEVDLLSKKLTPEEEERLIEQRARTIVERFDALERLEKEAAQFIGTDQYFDEEVQMIKKSRRYITAEQMKRFIEDFIKNNSPRTRLEYDPDTNLGKFYPDDKLNSILTRYSGGSEIAKYVGANRQGVHVTFESQAAFDNPKVDFINVLHPVTRSIVKYYTEGGGIPSNAHHVVLKTNQLLGGFYLYFIYRLRVRAARGVNVLEMVVLKQDLEIACRDEEAEILLGEMVERGEESKGISYEVDPDATKAACLKASEIFLERVTKIREEISRNNDAFIDRRIESLRTSYGKSLKLQNELLEKAKARKGQERYIRMLEGTIRRLDGELEEKQETLKKQRRVEVEYDDIAAGILEVIEESFRN